MWQIINENLFPIEHYELINEEINGEHSYFIEYYKSCRRGAINPNLENEIIGVELMTQLEELIHYIVNPKRDIRYTLKEAHKRIKFIEKECKHFESPFAGKPFLLSLYQKAFCEALFGFYYFDEEYQMWLRLHQEVLLLVGRKNGKTPFVSAIILAEWFCGEKGQKVMCASNDYEQAALVFDCISNMREESRTLEKVTRKNVKGIFFGNPKQKKKSGKFSKQNKGSIKKLSAKGGAKEGRNLRNVVVDEIHEMKNRDTVMPLSSSLSTQLEPLYIEITTEGIIRDGYLDERLKEARKKLKGELNKPKWLVWLFTQDNELEIYQNKLSWKKSNPMLGICKKWSYLEEKLEEAKSNNVQKGFTLAKEFNIKQLSSSAWLDDTIILNPTTFNIEDFKNCWCIIGVDLSETNDLTAITFLFMKENDNHKYCYTMYFVPESKAGNLLSTESPTNKEKKNYYQWEAEGYCRVISGNMINDETIANYIRKIHDEYFIKPYKIGYDLWHAEEFSKITAFHFGKETLYQVPMTYKVLNSPMRNVEEDLRTKLLIYNNNPICIWNFRNTTIKYDNNGLAMPEKIRGYIGNKIDGTMSKIIAYATLKSCYSSYIRKIGG